MPIPATLPSLNHRFIPAAGVRIHVAELPGPEKPLVLLHGIGMDYRVFQAVSRRLHAYFRLFMIDLRGHGSSDKPAAGYSLAHYAADVEDVLDALHLAGVTLAGSSLGGMVAGVVEVPSDIVSHRVLIDPPLTGGPLRDAEMLAGILARKHGPIEELVRYLASFNPGAGQHYLRTMAEMWANAADGVLSEPLARPHDYFAIDRALQAIDAPTLLLQGDAALGAVLTDEQAAAALALLPHGSLIHVAGAGHAVHAFKPAEFTRLVAEFAGATPAITGTYNGHQLRSGSRFPPAGQP